MRQIILILTICFLPILASAGILGDNPPNDKILEIMGMRFDHRYKQAREELIELEKEHPNDPGIVFMRASNLFEEMQHREDFRRATELESLLEKATNLANFDSNNPWNIWIIGNCHIYRALLQIQQGKYFTAWKSSSRGMDYLKKALKNPITSHDAALSVGGYYYWKSSQLGFLTDIPFVADNSHGGIRLLYRAMQNSYYCREAAVHSLVYVYCDLENLDSAKVLRDSLHTIYPNSILPLWYDLAIGEASGDKDLFYLSADTLARVLDTLGKEQSVNKILVHLAAAQIASEVEKWEAVSFHVNSVFSQDIPDWVKKEKSNEINELEELAREAEKRGEECMRFPQP